MAWKFGDSFDHYATADLPTKYQDYGAGGGNGTRIVAGVGVDGTSGVEFYNGNGRVGRAVASSRPTCIAGHMWKSASLGANRVHSIYDGINERGQVTYVVNSDGSISVYRVYSNNAFMGYALSALLKTTAPGLILPNVQHHLQYFTTISATVGVAKIKVDGNLVMNETGLNTRNSEASGDVYSLVGIGGSNGSAFAWADDYWICDDENVGDGCNDFLGLLTGEVSRPNGAGVSSGWTPTSGANYTNVDDSTPDGDTTIVTANVVGTKDTYAHSPLVRIGSGIKCVQTVTTGKKTTGAARAIAHVTRSGGTDYYSGDLYLPAAYGMQISAQPYDPATAAPWANPAAVDATEIGEKLTV